MKPLFVSTILISVALAASPAAAQFRPPVRQPSKAEMEAQIRAQVRAELASRKAKEGKSVSWQANNAPASQVTAQARNMVGWQNAPSQQVQQQITTYAPSNQAAVATVISPGACERAIAAAEKTYRLPPYLLQAIALTESGQNNRPNPLAMNIMGRSHYARSIDEVLSIINRYGSRSSIDVGCAQVNLKFHGHRFQDWRSLLSPEANANYAAYHLTELHREMGGSWSRAVAAYHSRTPWRGMNYACLVSRKYGQIFGDNRRGCGPNIEMLAAYLQRTVNR